jgi:hypothetical protein
VHDIASISRRLVVGRREQRETADAAMDRRLHAPLPDGCLSVDCLLSTDGTIVMYYSRWTGADRVVEPVSGGVHLDTVRSRRRPDPMPA